MTDMKKFLFPVRPALAALTFAAVAALTGCTKDAFGRLAKKAGEMGIALEFSQKAIEKISEKGFDSVYGARLLRRAVQQHIEDKLADEILTGGVVPGESVLCDYGDAFVFLKQQMVKSE